MFVVLNGMADFLGEITYTYYAEYYAKINQLATCFIIVSIIIAVILGVAGKKQSCIIWLICGTIFWLFGGFAWLASLFVTF